jgi:polysaccharide export outer membrane protein
MSLGLRMFLAALAISLPLVGCSSQGSDLPMLTSAPAATASSYHLGAGDRLSIKVVGADDKTGEYTVGDNGTISIPLIGEIKAAGDSQQQLERELRTKLAQGYIKDPKVSVSIVTYRPFYIYGEVAKPGEYPYASGMRVLNAIATAGGYTYRANQSFVVISRHGEDRRAVGTTTIQPDDIVRVPERYF